MPLSKNKLKYIRSLEQKKHRKEEHAFVAEGHKSVGDLLHAGYHARLILATDDWTTDITLPSDTEMLSVSPEELQKASFLLNPQQVIGVFDMPAVPTTDDVRLLPQTQLCLCLDGVQDPGNLGTIIRTADWFGIKHIFCSMNTVDAYNPKVVQATMGSIARVSIHYTDINLFIQAQSKETPIYGTVLDGDNLYSTPLTPNGIIVMGNEGNGISDEIKQLLTNRLLIPPYPADSETAESLNVSIATAIICAEFRHRS